MTRAFRSIVPFGLVAVMALMLPSSASAQIHVGVAIGTPVIVGPPVVRVAPAYYPPPAPHYYSYYPYPYPYYYWSRFYGYGAYAYRGRVHGPRGVVVSRGRRR